MSVPFMRALLERDLAAAAREIDASVPSDLPDRLDGFLQFRLADLAVDPDAQPWLGRAIVATDADEAGRRWIIGSVGFHAPPGCRRAGRGRLPRRARVPPAGRRHRGRRGALRLGGSRARHHPLPRLDRPRQRRLAGGRLALRVPADGGPARRRRRRGARVRSRRLDRHEPDRPGAIMAAMPHRPTPTARRSELRHAGRPRRRRARRADRGGLAADLPDEHLRAGRRSGGRAAATSTPARRTPPASDSNERWPPSRAGRTASRSRPGPR